MGTDKGFLTLHGKTFMKHIIEALKPLVSEIIISSDNPDYDGFGLRRIEDAFSDAGPLAGIYSGLDASNTAYNLVVSCDAPLIRTEILKKLMEQTAHETDVIMFKKEYKMMPLIGLYNINCKVILKSALERGERRLLSVLEHVKTKTIGMDKNDQALANINTRAELNELKTWF